MNRLIGKKVKDRNLGDGTIIEVNEKLRVISVSFPNIDTPKRYGFPIAIGKALSSEDPEVLSIAEEISKPRCEEPVKKIKTEQLTEEEKKLKVLSDNAIMQANEDLQKINPDEDFSDNEKFSIFKVHQGKTFFHEYDGGYLWAPQSGIHHHERMKEVKKGDIIFHYANGALQAIGEALSDCISYPQPAALYGHGWGTVGYYVKVRYQQLAEPFSLVSYKTEIIAQRANRNSSFDCNGDTCQGYLYDLELILAKLFKTEILKTPQPAGVVSVLNRIK